MLLSKKVGCGKCILHFKDRDVLVKHVREAHDGESTYMCITADEYFD